MLNVAGAAGDRLISCLVVIFCWSVGVRESGLCPLFLLPFCWICTCGKEDSFFPRIYQLERIKEHWTQLLIN
jgi:hypothetical protein